MAKSSDIIKIGFDYRASLEQFEKETNGVFDGISEKAGKQRISIQLDAKNDKVIEKIKELQKLKLDKFTFEFGESGLAEQLKTFDQLEKKITEIINLSKGTGTKPSSLFNQLIDTSDIKKGSDELNSALASAMQRMKDLYDSGQKESVEYYATLYKIIEIQKKMWQFNGMGKKSSFDSAPNVKDASERMKIQDDIYDDFRKYSDVASDTVDFVIQEFSRLKSIGEGIFGENGKILSKSMISSLMDLQFDGSVIEHLEIQEKQVLATAEAHEKLAKAQKDVSSTPIKDTFQGQTPEIDKATNSVNELIEAEKELVEVSKQAQKIDLSNLGHTDNSQPANIEKYQQSTTRAPRNSKLLSADNKLELGTELKRLQTEIIASLDETTTFIKEVTDFYDSQNNLVKTQMKVLDKNNSMRTYTTSYSVDKEGNANTWTSHITTEKIAEQEKVAQKHIETLRKISSEKQKLEEKDRQSTVNSALKDQLSAYKDIQSIREKIAKTTNDEELSILNQQKKVAQQQYLNAEKVLKANVDLYDNEARLSEMEKIRLETNRKLASYGESQVKAINDLVNNNQAHLDKLRPTEGNRSVEFENAVQEYNKAIIALREFHKTLDSSTPLTKEQSQKYEELSTSLKEARVEMEKFSATEKGSTEGSRWKEIDKITKYLKKNTRISKIAKQQLEDLINTLKNVSGVNVDNIHLQFNKITEAERAAGREGKSFFDILTDKAVYGAAARLASYYLSFYDFIRYTRNAVTAIRELDTALIDLKKTTAMTSSQLEEFYFDSNDVAKEMGVTTKAIIDQASAWSRLGYNTKEASTEMAKLSSQFASISPGMDLDTSTDGLVSTMKAFDIEVEDVERRIMDNINRIGNTAATSNGEIVDMLTRSSAAMAVANNTLEETIALETAAVEITRNAESTGTAFKTNLCLYVQKCA